MNVGEVFAEMREQTTDDQAAATLTLAAAIAEHSSRLEELQKQMRIFDRTVTELGHTIQRSIHFR